MKELLVQRFLRDGGTAEELLAKHGVRLKPFNGKASLIYDQLGAPENDPLANQCRGLVLREGTWNALAYPFDRFFNHGTPQAAEIDWSTAAFEEKLDGTLLIVYWDDVSGHWRAATRSMSEAHGDVDGVGTFAELADRASIRLCGLPLDGLMCSCKADRGCTFMFELTGPYNRIVCQYEELGLTLLGVRDLTTFEELRPELWAATLGVPVPRRWHFSNLTELAEVMRDWHPAQHEGVVVKDAQFRRVKVKSPQYVAAHHATDSLGSSWRSCTEAVLSGAADDIESLVPEYVRERIVKVKGALRFLTAKVEEDMLDLGGIDDMKEFAASAVVRIWPAALFTLKRGKAESMEAFLKGASPDHVLAVIEKALPGLLA